jgi:glutathione S-transferase
MDITLFHDRFWISPYVYSVFVALREKNAKFTEKAVALDKREQHEASFRDKSLTAKVPALSHGDFWLSESSAIVEYLDETLPGRKLLPVDPRERARARQIMSWLRSDLMPLREERSTNTMFYERADKPLSEAARLAAGKLVRVASDLVGAKGSLFGEFSIADADLAFSLHRLILNGDEVPAKVREFADGVWQRGIVQEFVTKKRPAYVAY